MPRLKPFDKKASTTYRLLSRPLHDPLIHDSDAPSQILAEVIRLSPSRPSKKGKIKDRGDLEEEFGFGNAVRENEGEAAEHGIFYDDSSYDYMQHMRELGGATESTWVEAAQGREKQKGRNKQKLEDALREMDLEDDVRSVDGLSFAGSSISGNSRAVTYQDQQDVPDAIAGFQPDMDPRLREVLEALDDEEYVDDDDDIFAQLAGDGAEEVDQDEWEVGQFENDEDGWESDDTTKPEKEYKPPAISSSTHHALPQGQVLPADPNAPLPETALRDTTTSSEDGAWMASFAKLKETFTTIRPPLEARRPGPKRSEIPSSLITSSTDFRRGKKRKGALTSSTNFSMTSSALARTEPLTLLDSRFDKLLESYMEDGDDGSTEMDDVMSVATATTANSRATRFSACGDSRESDVPKLVPANFDNVMDDFLRGSNVRGSKAQKGGSGARWGGQTPMEQLDEVRAALGPARISKVVRAAQQV